MITIKSSNNNKKLGCSSYFPIVCQKIAKNLPTMATLFGLALEAASAGDIDAKAVKGQKRPKTSP
jgi:hypothetical protein